MDGRNPIVEMIDPALEQLMERFFDSSHKDVDQMRMFLEAEDYSGLARLGHTAKGTGYGYGFRGMGDIGCHLETAARNEDRQGCAEHISRMKHYLDNVKVEFRK
ncbi:Hpt domain-containing protein [Pseudodesulfovibrio cashew]|uniref:Hpt domain-containing protein n=1 Tax=Pseudodesulfovibrio cashew TaxID=2678688 RepID=A0A6I6JIT8_9BACT|nr:Hpt domain-containing protein [Pseudodesulfovibrio cashew]QGY40868.1 Hpt domain-containing protein [Pseudodesulfovibrio cashew]